MKFVDLHRQYQAYKNEIEEALARVFDSSNFILGQEVAQLERELAGYVGARGAVGVSSGTDAMLLVLMALGVGRRDVVITTPFTFIATAEVISLTGARPVFSDIDPDTFNMDVNRLEATIEQQKRAGHTPKGIIVVDLFGQCADMDEIMALAGKHGLFVMEDACQSFGATYAERRACGLGTVAVTSFFPAKPLGCYGDGGMIFSDDEALLDELRALRNHGQKERYCHQRIGLNARLDTMQAAILRVKFRHFDDEINARRTISDHYSRLLGDLVPHIKPPVVRPDRTSVYAQYTIRIPGGKRDLVRQRLGKMGIPTAVHYPRPLHLQPCFAGLGHGPGAFPHAENAAKEVLSLPMYPFITPQEQHLVVEALAKALDSI